jgi:tryptophan halogenase
MRENHIRKIVILGGGTAGWMSAAALSKINTPPQFEISLVESDDIGTIGVGEATIPTIHWFNNLAGLDEREFLRETKATFKLGIEFQGWTGAGTRFFHPFGIYGDPADGPMFYHRWIRAWLKDKGLDHQKLSLAASLAYAGRFAPEARSAGLGYAYHFDAGLYAAYLRRIAEGRGVKRTEGKIARVEQDGETGFVTALFTHRGDRLEGDLFIDCSGLRALLIEETLHTGFEDWSHWLVADRALAVPSTRIADPVPFTRSIAHGFGWQWRIPLQHRTGNGMVYGSRFASDDEARAALFANIDGEVLAEPRLIRFTTGKRRQAWNKNVVAIGLSSGFLEPLESTSIHLIQSGIAKLLALFPARDCNPLTARQFNTVFDADMRAVRDFLILHYRNTTGRNEEMWRYCQAMKVPDELLYKEEMFRASGRIVLNTEELFREASWFAVMMGQGIHPADYNPLIAAFSESADNAHFARLSAGIAALVQRAPGHMQVVDRMVSGR